MGQLLRWAGWSCSPPRSPRSTARRCPPSRFAAGTAEREASEARDTAHGSISWAGFRLKCPGGGGCHPLNGGAHADARIFILLLLLRLGNETVHILLLRRIHLLAVATQRLVNDRTYLRGLTSFGQPPSICLIAVDFIMTESVFTSDSDL